MLYSLVLDVLISLLVVALVLVAVDTHVASDYPIGHRRRTRRPNPTVAPNRRGATNADYPKQVTHRLVTMFCKVVRRRCSGSATSEFELVLAPPSSPIRDRHDTSALPSQRGARRVATACHRVLTPMQVASVHGENEDSFRGNLRPPQTPEDVRCAKRSTRGLMQGPFLTCDVARLSGCRECARSTYVPKRRGPGRASPLHKRPTAHPIRSELCRNHAPATNGHRQPQADESKAWPLRLVGESHESCDQPVGVIAGDIEPIDRGGSLRQIAGAIEPPERNFVTMSARGGHRGVSGGSSYGDQEIIRRWRQGESASSIGPARGDQSFETVFRRYLVPDLLIVDDFGLQRLSRQQSEDFDALVIERHRRARSIVTNNRDVSQWVEFFPDPILANSALDQLADRAQQFVIEGPSYRAELAPRSPEELTMS